MSEGEWPTQDLTRLIETVIAGRDFWSEEKARRLLDRCAALYVKPNIWWEVGSDDWPSFQLGDESVFTVHVRFPLCLVQSLYAVTLEPLIREAGAEVIAYDDWAAAAYRVRPGLLNALAGQPVEEGPDDQRTDPEKFSMWDLWYDTL